MIHSLIRFAILTSTKFLQHRDTKQSLDLCSLVRALRPFNRRLEMGHPSPLSPRLYDSKHLILNSGIHNGYYRHTDCHLQHLHLNFPLLARQLCLGQKRRVWNLHQLDSVPSIYGDSKCRHGDNHAGHALTCGFQTQCDATAEGRT